MLGNERNSDLNDPEFVDQAWSEMAKMLDQEMPVAVTNQTEERSKRYGLLILFLLIGFVSGIGTMFFLQKGMTSETQEPQNPASQVPSDQPMANRFPHKEYLISTAESEEMVSENIDAVSIENSIQKEISRKTNTRSYSQTPSKQDVNQLKPYLSSSSVIVQSTTPKDQLTVFDTPRLNSKHEKTEIQIVKEVTSEQAIKTYRPTIVTLHPLDEKAIAALDWNAPTPSLRIQALALAPKLSYGLYIGTQTRNFDGLHGLTSGVYASYRLDSKFSLRTGLGYSLIKGFQSRTIGIAEPLTPEFFDPIDININDYSTVAPLENNQDLPFQSLHYLDLPIALDYRMADNFGILMGLKVSYLLKAKTDGYFSDNLNDDEAARLDDALYNSLRKIDVATVLGLGFYPASNIGLELRYNHGLVDYTKDKNWHIRQLNTNKTFELSMNYFLR